ncbi:hypothetical protein [Lacisediminihabitans profunda]|uniref:Cupin domain-containing protein n=1 Tax=Lacisediminihabitans profunda TaxID=2594790 RepID=A0A5C8UKX5_9MICO|nr:hypothetical protein [Lacisediminihabitans profunda]TXN28935.1 hypothetical protein FVP33_15545 [Lacisediminihabitans profunda]
MFESTDPRSSLPDSAGATVTPAVDATIVEFGARLPDHEDGTSRTWKGASQRLTFAYTRFFPPGGTVHVAGEAAEHLVLVLGSAIRVESGAEVVDVPAGSIVIVPAGDSRITTEGPTQLLRVFSRHDGLPGSADIRHYRLEVPPETGRFGRIYTGANIMVNVMYPTEGPRDTNHLSPHSHDSFEQCSVTLDGEFVHHLRWPWKERLVDWREDLHRAVSSPSLTVIPAGVIHTTRAVGDGSHLLIDVFSPPREDFAAMPGWVLNAARDD